MSQETSIQQKGSEQLLLQFLCLEEWCLYHSLLIISIMCTKEHCVYKGAQWVSRSTGCTEGHCEFYGALWSLRGTVSTEGLCKHWGTLCVPRGTVYPEEYSENWDVLWALRALWDLGPLSKQAEEYEYQVSTIWVPSEGCCANWGSLRELRSTEQSKGGCVIWGALSD